MSIAAFLFQRSLRLDDNLGLVAALRASKTVLPVFCVDPRQASARNGYLSPFCLGFMEQCLRDLQLQLAGVGSQLLVVHGEPHVVLPDVLTRAKVATLYLNADSTPFAHKRAEELTTSLSPAGIDVQCVEGDDRLHALGSVLTGTGTAFRMFTPFYLESQRLRLGASRVAAPELVCDAADDSLSKVLMRQAAVTSLRTRAGLASNEEQAWGALTAHSQPPPFSGGRATALRILAALPNSQRQYHDRRDFLSYDTSHLSAYLKFGCVSVREVWHAIKKIAGNASVELARQLIWREFYAHYYAAFPSELEWDTRTPAKIAAIDAEVRALVLSDDTPDIVKACFNELDRTGFLHNRGRMILANYVLKYAGRYWKDGDVLFARRLVDYDPVQNIGNWRWIAKQPAFKTLKPETQHHKFDRAVPGAAASERGAYTAKWLAAPVPAAPAQAGKRRARSPS